MNFRDIFQANVNSANFILGSYLKDLTDQNLLVRPVPNANTIAWQLGHLIVSNNKIIKFLDPDHCPTLPAGFEASYSKVMATENNPGKFHTRAVYMEILEQQKEAATRIISNVNENDLDKPGPEEMRNYAPTVGALILLLANHLMMHVGQFAVVRRVLGKPVVI